MKFTGLESKDERSHDMIRNPTLKQLLKAEKEDKSVLCNICGCENVRGMLRVEKIVGSRTYLKHQGNIFSLAFRLKGRWMWTTQEAQESIFNPKYWIESRKMRRSIIILP